MLRGLCSKLAKERTVWGKSLVLHTTAMCASFMKARSDLWSCRFHRKRNFIWAIRPTGWQHWRICLLLSHGRLERLSCRLHGILFIVASTSAGSNLGLYFVRYHNKSSLLPSGDTMRWKRLNLQEIKQNPLCVLNVHLLPKSCSVPTPEFPPRQSRVPPCNPSSAPPIKTGSNPSCRLPPGLFVSEFTGAQLPLHFLWISARHQHSLNHCHSVNWHHSTSVVTVRF